MPLAELVLALFVLLATPGPTNTLMALAGAHSGGRGLGRFMVAELAAYLLVTLPLALAGASLLEAVPGARHYLAGAAAAWVFWLAVRMWRLPRAAGGARPITPAQVFVTTLLNPKALVIGLVLLPSSADLAPRVGVLAGVILICAAGWGALGARAVRGLDLPPLLLRIAAGWLALLSAGLASAAVAA